MSADHLTSDYTDTEIARIHRRTVGILAVGQVLSGVGFGATVSLGALLAADISGSDALSGLATASVTLGAALCAIPLARMAARRGRRLALTLGNLLALGGIAVVIIAVAMRVFPMFLTGIIMIGAGNAGNLQARFAATDLAATKTRGRDLSIVVWSTTVGGVVGPLLLKPGEIVGQSLGMPTNTGAYVFSLVAATAAFVLYLIALRPDPLQVAQGLESRGAARGGVLVSVDQPRVARYAIFAVAGSHTVMASVMAMTPVHLSHMTADPDQVTVIVGITISLHVAGMYGLSPIFGILADRVGRVAIILLGQVILAAALVAAYVGSHSEGGVMVALILLGLGWSAATVSGSALLTEATATSLRPKRQGISDSLMSLCAAVGATGAGWVLSRVEYHGLAIAALGVVVLVTALSPLALRRATATPVS